MDQSNLSKTYLGKTRFQCEAAAWYRRSYQGPAGQRLTAWACSAVRELFPAGRVLDLACGNGRHFAALSQGGCAVVGGDISEPMLQEARKHQAPRGTLSRFEAENIPFKDQSFDVVFSARFFHHLPNRSVRKGVLSEVFRVARRGAVITFKAKFTYEHLRTILKNFLRESERSRYFISMREISQAAKASGWVITWKYSRYGVLSANRVVVVEPKDANSQ